MAWRFIPERSPNFGGLWEASVRSAKTHLKRIMGSVKLTYEELTTVLAQIEACLNGRPLVPASSPDDDAIEALTPGHFLIGKPLCALPDPASYLIPFYFLTSSLAFVSEPHPPFLAAMVWRISCDSQQMALPIPKLDSWRHGHAERRLAFTDEVAPGQNCSSTPW